MSQQTLPDLDWALLDRIREAIRAVEPDARIILYGSRARGDADPESDWDLLVLLDGPVDRRRVAAVRHRLYALERETDTILSAVVHSHDEWNSPLYRAMPFRANVMHDGIPLADPSRAVTLGGTDADSADAVQVSEGVLMAAREEIILSDLDEARGTLGDAELMAQAESWNSCVNRLYYACFYAVTALLLRHGLSSATHKGVQNLFNQHFRRTGVIASDLVDLYNTLFPSRLAGGYQAFVRFQEEEVRPWLAQARAFVARIEELLDAPPPEGSDG